MFTVHEDTLSKSVRANVIIFTYHYLLKITVINEFNLIILEFLPFRSKATIEQRGLSLFKMSFLF